MSSISEDAEMQSFLAELELPHFVHPNPEQIKFAWKVRGESKSWFNLMRESLFKEKEVKVRKWEWLVVSEKEAETWLTIAYHKGEQSRLYGNGCFLVEVKDLSKKGEINIWRVENATRSLQKYVPLNHRELEFFASTPQMRKIKSESFFQQFQPIVVNVVTETHSLTTVQVVYLDQAFFKRMAKSMGRIYLSDALKQYFMDGILVAVKVSYDGDFLRGWGKLSENEKDPQLKKAVDGWLYIKTYIDQHLNFLMDNCGLNKETWNILFEYPHFVKWKTHEIKICSDCTEFPSRKCDYRVVFQLHFADQWPYNRETLENRHNSLDPGLNKPLYLCGVCAEKATKIQRLMHFQYYLFQVKRQHVERDIEAFRPSEDKDKLPLADIIMWIHDLDNYWKNKMWLDFQITLAETEEIPWSLLSTCAGCPKKEDSLDGLA